MASKGPCVAFGGPKRAGWLSVVIVALCFLALSTAAAADDPGQQSKWQSRWNDLKALKQFSDQTFDEISERRRERGDNAGAYRIQHLKTWYSSLGFFRGLPRLAASVAWGIFSSPDPLQDLSWFWGSSGADGEDGMGTLIFGFMEAREKGELAAWFQQNGAKVQDAAVAAWERGKRTGSGALAQLQHELLREVGDPYLAGDVAKAVLARTVLSGGHGGESSAALAAIQEAMTRFQEWAMPSAAGFTCGTRSDSNHEFR